MRELVILYRAFKVQWRVLYALMMREIITRYGRENLGFLWLFLEPAIFTLAVTILWSIVRAGHGHADFPIAALALTGYTASLAWRYGAGRTLAAVQSNIALLYHSRVTVFDLIVSRIMLEVVGATGSFAVLTLIFSSVGLIDFPHDLSFVALGWYLQIWFSVGLAFLVGALGAVYEVVDRIWHVTSYILFILSGAFFLVEWLPPAYREYALLMPTINNIELIRYGFVGDAMIPHYDIPYSAMFNLYLSFFALVSYLWVRNKIEPE